MSHDEMRDLVFGAAFVVSAFCFVDAMITRDVVSFVVGILFAGLCVGVS